MSKNLVDEKGVPVKATNRPYIAMLHKFEFEPPNANAEAEEWGQKTLMVIFILITLWMLTFFIFTGTATPMILVILNL